MFQRVSPDREIRFHAGRTVRPGAEIGSNLRNLRWPTMAQEINESVVYLKALKLSVISGTATAPATAPAHAPDTTSSPPSPLGNSEPRDAATEKRRSMR